MGVEPGDCAGDSPIKVYVEEKTEMLTMQILPVIETWQREMVETG